MILTSDRVSTGVEAESMYLDQDNGQLTASDRQPVGPATWQVASQLRELASRLETGSAGSAFTLIDERISEVASLSGAMRNDRPDYLAKVRSVIRARSVRIEVFGPVVADDPAWTILLDLFEAHLTERTRCVKSVTIASGSPMTTALRYLTILGELSLVERQADPSDRRRTFLRLTQAGRQKMIRYFDLVC